MLSPSDKRSETEYRILEAAQHEFVTKGLNGARLQVIADSAGVNKALLHYYFRSKQKLYEAVLQDIIARFGAAIRENVSSDQLPDDILALIEAMVRTYIFTMRIHPDFPRMFMREIADGSVYLPEVVKGLVHVFGDIPSAILTKLSQSNLSTAYKTVPPFHIIINIIGMCAASFLVYPTIDALGEQISQLGLENENDYFESRIKAITAMACHGLFHNGNTQ